MKKLQKREREIDKRLVLTLLATITLFLATFVIATPTGPSGITHLSNETKGTTNGRIVNISGGYISNFNITATVQNPNWKAFVGEIDGKFTLDDAGGSTIYDWSLTTVGGEVYATRASGAISWGTISCADAGEITTEETALNHTGEDNISSTFTASSNVQTFVVAGQTIGAGSCSATNTYVNNASQGTEFEEVILHDTSNIIYTTILEEDETGYDGTDYDFQMLVPEVALDTWASSTAYYLYVELS
jgi:hypothetical protein